MYVVKRDGRKEIFNSGKIQQAVEKALTATGADNVDQWSRIITDRVVADLNENFSSGDGITIEYIQDKVEDILMRTGNTKVARSYIRYRFQHEIIRNQEKAKEENNKLFSDYLGLGTWEIKENSNMGFSVQGLNRFVTSKATNAFWQSILPAEVGKAHETGALHNHDTGDLAPYCVGWDLKDLLLVGFRGAEGKTTSKPARHFRSALGQIVNFVYTLQGEAAGAQALSSFDTYLAPFVRADKLDYGQVKQGIQEFIFNVNVPTRVGFQSPFFNITLDVRADESAIKDEPAIVDGRLLDVAYRDFQEEMDIVNLAFCEVMLEGDADGNIFSFPIPTYNITKGFNWNSEVSNAIFRMTDKYGIPYFANFINSDMNPEDARSMCCRLRLDNRELRKRGGGLFGANPLTGSIGVITLNLPLYGYLAKGNWEKYIELVDNYMAIGRSTLETKRKILEKLTDSGLYPYTKFYLRDIKKRFGKFWTNHFSTIGLVGMNEAIRNFTSDTDNITTAFGQDFAKRTLEYMRGKIQQFQEEDGDLYNLEATPAEGTSYRLARLNKKHYPDIITAGEEEPYYTNSTHLPVNYTSDLFKAVELQNDLQTLYTGGTVLHGYLAESIDELAVAKAVVRRIFEKYELPYFTLTPTFSICEDHKYIKGEHFNCPICGRETLVMTRVTGFYRPVSAMNPGKQEEKKETRRYVVAGITPSLFDGVAK
ncbi:anaerobic ribonucleoside-triphosphate reductase [Syntrophobotulus glycolicus DSM 8271]|uniref:Anaerobic ribonucleoside-triphosphate reductase n=1 Tax=Syntrophobotulus glycolicus (strain DSM 8271 / FlGlyR) TaxID=645991 RepID=F0SXT8_SYNGF|nr:ribonucleoside triphosphate reductase [Syntrophobotulus glycolicus]ADY56999.1 anaerobic ribonucleoside-triphosphate reductase [Syntrophobotulus glycolicus DSM 8271]